MRDYDLQLQVIVVGSSADTFVGHVANMLSDYEVDFTLCGNVYSAVGKLAKNKSEDVLIIGRIEHLSKDQGRFFHIACQYGYTCFCLTDDGGLRNRKPILAAMQKGALVTSDVAELEGLIKKILKDRWACPTEKRETNETQTLIKDEFLATKAELDALLRA